MESKRILALIAVLGGLWIHQSQAVELPEIQLTRDGVVTGKHRFTLSESGLPAQIEIKAVDGELPLERRGKTDKSWSGLVGLGRGAILNGPVVIEATLDGNVAIAQVVKAAKPGLKGGNVVCKSSLRAGSLDVGLALAYGPDGSIEGSLTYGGGKIESLSIVVPILGPVDVVIPGQPTAAKLEAYPASRFTIGQGEGLVWGNAAKDAKRIGVQAIPGVLTHLYVGSGDRGFTWLCETGDGWSIDSEISTMTLERDDVGQLTWRIMIVNRPTELSKQKRVKFAILVHPVSSKMMGHRKTAWLEWPDDSSATGGTVTLKEWTQAKAIPVLRADRGTVMERFSDLTVLTGPAGGDALSAKTDHIGTYPMALMRYLAGAHTGNTVMMRSNAAQLSHAGANPSTDRVLLGRALLLDLGLDVSSVAHRTEAARILSALQKFGYFKSDGKTEVIPFWRSQRVARFGQPWIPGSSFSADVENPLEKVYVTVYRRPIVGQEGYYQALMVIANESEKAVRDTLYVMDPPGLFGGPNMLQESDVVGQHDFTHLPERSDWGKPGATFTGIGHVVLEDLDDKGHVPLFSKNDGMESYGPTVFVRPHDFRILYGKGGPAHNSSRRRRRAK